MKRVKNSGDKGSGKGKISKIFKPTKKKVIWTIIVLLVLGVAAKFAFDKKKVSKDAEIQTDIVTRGDIEISITGSASVEPYERFEIIPKVSGDITYCPYDVGDSVSEGDVLYRFDTSDTNLTVERQKISLQQSKNNYDDALEDKEKLSIKAKSSGTISNLTIKAGQDVSNGQKIADISNTDTLDVVLPFTIAQVGSIKVGDAASITSSKHMSSVDGKVTHIATSSYGGADGSALYDVTISFKNPGVFYEGMTVGGAVGNNVSPGSGTIQTSISTVIKSETEGTVSKVLYSNGDYVKEGTVIATLTSETISNKIEDSTLSYKNATLSMQQTEKDLEDYRITSPISGTVITKNSKAGDTIDKTNATTTMMVVADVSKLKFDLSIDELDVSKVSAGQGVDITCDALPDETFKGVITKVSVEGEAQNGVTTYSAEVVIDNPGNLRPSMNIDASVIVDAVYDVLRVPTEDIKTVGGVSYVFVKDDSKDTDKKDKNKSDEKKERPGVKAAGLDDEEGASKEKPEGMSEGATEGKGQRPEGATEGKGQRPEGAPEGKGQRPEGMPEGKGQRPEGAPEGKGEKPEGMPEGKGEKPEGMPEDADKIPENGEGKKGRGAMAPEAPEGFKAVRVEIGLANDEFTEIKSGLFENQEIYRQSTISTSNKTNNLMGMGGNHGGMSGGMGGGMSGGSRGGNMGGGMSGGSRGGNMGGGNRGGNMGGGNRGGNMGGGMR